MKKTLLMFAPLVFGLFTISCSKKKEENVETGTLQMSMKLVAASSTAGLTLAETSPSDFRSTAIVSGPPDEMKIKIKSMALVDESGSSQVTIFTDSAGRELAVKSGSIDLSDLFTTYSCLDKNGTPVEGVECPCGLDSDNKPVEKENGVCKYPEGFVPPSGLFEVQEGTFAKLRVEFGIAAKMKGCVTGNFSTLNNPAVQGVHTYCTNSAKSTFQTPQGGTNADFEIAKSQATEMEIQLGSETPMKTSTDSTYRLEFPIKDGITITKGAKADLTMVIDTNRMLRFYNQNTPNQGPSPGSPLNTSYFFTSQVFDNSVFVFVGKPGEIRGFQTWTEACNTTPKPSTRLCASGSSTSVVTGWITLVKDSDKLPLLFSLNPDDDNTLTIIKGSNKSEKGIDKSLIVADGSNYNLTYKLGTEGGGTVYGVNIDAAVGSTQTTTFECKIQANDYYGKIYLKRLL